MRLVHIISTASLCMMTALSVAASQPPLQNSSVELAMNRSQEAAAQRYYQQNRHLYERLQQYQGNNRRGYTTQRSNRRPATRTRVVRSQNQGIYRKTNKFKPGNMPSKIEGRGEKVFIFNPSILTWAAYDRDGNLVRKGHGSGGAHRCQVGKRMRNGCHTPSGSFRIHAKRGANCVSGKYPLPNGGAKMPYCMFFHKGYAIHGSGYVPYYNASHGCIRVYPSDARWLHSNFLHHGTKVEVKGY